MSSVFVTGGSGFVGGRLIERLRAEGHDVRALARSDASAERVRSLGAEPVAGELADRTALRAGAEGCELAFHAAATLGDSGSRDEFERGNVQGTENVLRACAEAGVRRLIHVSTEAVLFAGRPLVQVDESAPLQPSSKALYSATKARAEQAIVFSVKAWDANCPQHIPQLVDVGEVVPAIVERDRRIAELEAEVARLRRGD